VCAFDRDGVRNPLCHHNLGRETRERISRLNRPQNERLSTRFSDRHPTSGSAKILEKNFVAGLAEAAMRPGTTHILRRLPGKRRLGHDARDNEFARKNRPR
jgi:hypothetical protein